MFDSFGVILAIAGAWLVIGIVLSVVMGRRGHNSFGWLVLGVVLGPLGVVLALDSRRHDEGLQPTLLAGDRPVTVGGGSVDVLVGYDGSPESAAAIDAAIDLLGDRLRRFTVATVVPYGGIQDADRSATERLRQLRIRTSGLTPELEVLHGHPSTALGQCASEGGYELIAIGTRGTGITKALLGSAASELARDSKVPVLLVGGQHTLREERHPAPAASLSPMR